MEAIKVTDRGKRGDEPRTNSVMRRQIVPYPAQLERAECSGVSATLWSFLSTETAHVNGG